MAAIVTDAPLCRINSRSSMMPFLSQSPVETHRSQPPIFAWTYLRWRRETIKISPMDSSSNTRYMVHSGRGFLLFSFRFSCWFFCIRSWSRFPLTLTRFTVVELKATQRETAVKSSFLVSSHALYLIWWPHQHIHGRGSEAGFAIIYVTCYEKRDHSW